MRSRDSVAKAAVAAALAMLGAGIHTLFVLLVLRLMLAVLSFVVTTLT